jgi:hypothetical protein
MIKKLILGAGLLVSLVAMAADVVPATAAQVQVHEKKSQGLVCQQEAIAQKLEGAAKKQFMVKCLKAAATAAPAQ